MEVSINTNATHLDKEMSEKLIKSGLDLIIYSFDGGTKNLRKNETRKISKNKFEKVYENIKNFAKMKTELKSYFPITKIQMVLTEETRKEIKNFMNYLIQL